MSAPPDETGQSPGETGSPSAPPAGMPDDLARAWHWELIRERRARVFERYFYMGLTAFGAVAGVATMALGIHSGETGFYAGTAVTPWIVLGGLLGLRKPLSEREQ